MVETTFAKTMTIYLGRTSQHGSSDLHPPIKAEMILHRVGLATSYVSIDPRELLPHVFTIASCLAADRLCILCCAFPGLPVFQDSREILEMRSLGSR